MEMIEPSIKLEEDQQPEVLWSGNLERQLGQDPLMNYHVIQFGEVAEIHQIKVSPDESRRIIEDVNAVEVFGNTLPDGEFECIASVNDKLLKKDQEAVVSINSVFKSFDFVDLLPSPSRPRLFPQGLSQRLRCSGPASPCPSIGRNRRGGEEAFHQTPDSQKRNFTHFR